jgi:hypothetical protein
VLATKFETLTSKNRATDSDGGEPKSQAYYIIKVSGFRLGLDSTAHAVMACIWPARVTVLTQSTPRAGCQANVPCAGSIHFC